MQHRRQVFPDDEDDVVGGLDDQAFEGDYDGPPEMALEPESSPHGDASDIAYRPLTAKMRARGLCGVALRYCDGRKVVFR